MEQEEKEITLKKVLEIIAECVLLIAGIVSIFALIWGGWQTLRYALTVMFVDALFVGFVVHLTNKFHK